MRKSLGFLQWDSRRRTPSSKLTGHLMTQPGSAPLAGSVKFVIIGPFSSEIDQEARDGILIEIRDRPVAGSIIEGWLQRADALKLFEIAYFVTGDILELGSYHGLSTSILARAAHDSPHKKNIFSVDLDMENVRTTNRHLDEMGLKSFVTTMCGDALSTMKGLASAGTRFDFVFVDHSHAYEAVYGVCRDLGDVLQPGGFCLFGSSSMEYMAARRYTGSSNSHTFLGSASSYPKYINDSSLSR